MNRYRVGVVFACLAPMMIWGCAEGPLPQPTADKNDAATRITGLQHQVTVLGTQRDQLKAELKGVCEQREKLLKEVEELQKVVAERNELKAQLAACTTERDAGMSHLEQLRKGMRALMEQSDAAMPVVRPAVSSAAN